MNKAAQDRQHHKQTNKHFLSMWSDSTQSRAAIASSFRLSLTRCGSSPVRPQDVINSDWDLVCKQIILTLCQRKLCCAAPIRFPWDVWEVLGTEINKMLMLFWNDECHLVLLSRIRTNLDSFTQRKTDWQNWGQWKEKGAWPLSGSRAGAGLYTFSWPGDGPTHIDHVERNVVNLSVATYFTTFSVKDKEFWVNGDVRCVDNHTLFH